jgi:hypothetical protein
MDVKLGLSPQVKRRKSVLGNRMLRRIFSPKAEKVMGSGRSLNNEKINN